MKAEPVIEKIRAIARECGYAVAVHGSQTRDLDLIAAPWTPEAVSADQLVATLCERVPLREQVANVYEDGHVSTNPEPKPWGRWAWSLSGCQGYEYVDLSVAPMKGAAAMPDPGHSEAALEAMRRFFHGADSEAFDKAVEAKLRKALADPGAFVKREFTPSDYGGTDAEPLHVWQTRAVLTALPHLPSPEQEREGFKAHISNLEMQLQALRELTDECPHCEGDGDEPGTDNDVTGPAPCSVCHGDRRVRSQRALREVEEALREESNARVFSEAAAFELVIDWLHDRFRAEHLKERT